MVMAVIPAGARPLAWASFTLPRLATRASADASSTYASIKLLLITRTVNPALARTHRARGRVLDDRAYVTSRRESAGGRGINASCVIHSFGGTTMAIVPAGGTSGAHFEEFLKCCGFELVLVPIRHEVRRNLIVTDKHGLTVKLNEPGAALDTAELARLEKTIRGKLDQASWFMICG